MIKFDRTSLAHQIVVQVVLAGLFIAFLLATSFQRGAEIGHLQGQVATLEQERLDAAELASRTARQKAVITNLLAVGMRQNKRFEARLVVAEAERAKLQARASRAGQRSAVTTPVRRHTHSHSSSSSSSRVVTGSTLGGDFRRLRNCESGGDYSINTGNGYYGAYQFDLRTWRGLGYSGMPHRASPATQDQAARRLHASRGWQPWPGCAKKLGLR